MPQLPIPTILPQEGVPAAPSMANPEGAAREFTGAVDSGLELYAREQDRKQRQADAAAKELEQRQAHSEAQLAVTNAVSTEHMTSLQALQDATDSGGMAGFTAQWQKDFDARTAAGATQIPDTPMARSLYQQQMAELRSRLQPAFAQKEWGARNIDLSRQAGDGIESDANVAYVDRSQAPDLMARRLASISLLAIPQPEKDQLADKARQTIGYSAGANWAQNDPAGFLRAVGVGAADPAAAAREMSANPVLSVLKPENLQRLTQHAQGLVAQQGAAAANEQAAREKFASDQLEKMRTLWESGQFPDLGQVADFRRSTQGTQSEPLMNRYLDMASSTAGFGARSLPQQAAIIQQADAEAAKNGTNTDAQQVLDHYRKINQAQVEAYKADPLAAGARFARLPPAPEQQIGSVDEALQLVQQRAPTLASYEVAAGAPGVSPLHPQEAQGLGRALRALPLDQQASALVQIGGSLGNQQRIGALAKQIGDQDGTLGAAMALSGQRTSLGRDVAFYLLRGEQAFKDKTVQDDTSKVSGWKATIAEQIRGAYPNTELASAAIDAAVKITAGLEAAGVSSGDTDRAVKLATGGIIKHGSADAKIPLPYGMTESDFDAKLAALKPADLAAQTHTPDFGAPGVAGMVAGGNIDLGTRPRVQNADGTVSTVRSISIGTDGGREVLIPTVSDDGKVLSNADAIALYRKTGRNLGTFDSEASATAYAQQLHRDQEQQYTRGGAREDLVFAGRAFMPVSQFLRSLPSATLEHAGQGQYKVRAGPAYVTNARGEPIVLGIKP